MRSWEEWKGVNAGMVDDSLQPMGVWEPPQPKVETARQPDVWVVETGGQLAIAGVERTPEDDRVQYVQGHPFD